jgi:hypothetical protein
MSSRNMAEYMAERRRNRRKQLIEMLGGVCVRCGKGEPLDFDHIIPETKLFNISSAKALDGPWERLLQEAAKCQLLCPECHRKKSKENGELGGGQNRIDDHGTEAMYQKGCRCDFCRQARRDARVRRGELKPGVSDKKYSGRGRYGTITEHGAGTSGVRGCKCTLCLATRAAYVRSLRKK